MNRSRMTLAQLENKARRASRPVKREKDRRFCACRNCVEQYLTGIRAGEFGPDTDRKWAYSK